MLGPALSHYRILRKLGEGGMGEVYLAEDLSLKRQVAVKVLPEGLRRDPERLRRFRTEAEAAAKLNHPNIAHIYTIEEADITDVETRHVASLLFITMEYVDGQPLHHLIPQHGLALDLFFTWFFPLSDALTHAHEHGVTHRDLKPGNIMVSKEGIPKILDFGLARITRPEPEPEVVDHDAPTKTMKPNVAPAPPSLTQGRVILGTPAYMSPEQAEGKKADPRTDVFSFGVVMYEAVTGQRPFQGETYESLIGRILTYEPPPVTTSRPETPYLLNRVITKCLQKERRTRYQTSQEVANDLQEVKRSQDTGTVVVAMDTASQAKLRAAAPFWRRPLPVAAMVVVGLILGSLAAWVLKPSPEPPLRKFQMPVEFSDNGNLLFAGPVISPDGTMVAYPQGNRLWVRSLSQTEPRDLPGTERAVRPFWSPDSRFVGYFVVGTGGGEAIRAVAVQGGSSTPVCTLSGGWPRGATWNAAGDIVFSLTTTGDLNNSGALYTVPSQGGTPRVFLRADSSRGELGLIYPQFLPDGQSLVCAMTTADSAGTLVVVSGDTRTTVVRQPGERLAFPGYASSGHLVYQRGFPNAAGVWAVPVGLGSRTKTGDPFLVADKMAIPSVSVDGTLVYRSAPLSAGGMFQLVWVDRSGKVEGTIGQPQAGIFTPALSPDGRRVAVSAVENGNRDIWVHDAIRGTRTRLTSDPVDDRQPAWSPTGGQLAFSSLRSGVQDIFLQAADGNTAQPVVTGPLVEWGPSWSWDGRYLIYDITAPNTDDDLWYVPLTGERKPMVFLQTSFFEVFPVFSPDGRYVAYESDESGRAEIYVKPFPRGEGRWPVSVNGGVYPRWWGNELFYVEGNTLMAVSVDTRSGFQAGLPQKLFTGESVRTTLFSNYDVAAGGKRFVVAQRVGEEKAATPVMTVVEQWVREFKKAGKSEE